MFKLVHTRTPKFWVTNSTRGKTCKWKNIFSSLRYTSLHFMFRFFSRSAALAHSFSAVLLSVVRELPSLFSSLSFSFFSFLFRANRILLPTTSSLHTATMITVWVPNVYTCKRLYFCCQPDECVSFTLALRCAQCWAELSWAALCIPPVYCFWYTLTLAPAHTSINGEIIIKIMVSH